MMHNSPELTLQEIRTATNEQLTEWMAECSYEPAEAQKCMACMAYMELQWRDDPADPFLLAETGRKAAKPGEPAVMIPDCPECGGTGCGAPEFEDEMGASMCDRCAGTGMTPAGMAAESAVKDAVIRRFAEGYRQWFPGDGQALWSRMRGTGADIDAMTPAERAVLENLQ